MEILKIINYDFILKISKNIDDPKYKKDSLWVDLNNKEAHDYLVKTLPKLDKAKLPTINIKGADLYFVNLWNKFIKNKLDKRGMENFIFELGNSLTYYSIFVRHTTKKQFKEELQRHLRFSDSRMECRNSGDRYTLYLNKDGSIGAKKYVTVEVSLPDGRKTWTSKEVPLNEDNFKDVIYEKEIVLKTGKLIINDWFRTTNNEFTEIVKNKERVSINYAKGRVEQISDYADKNFVSVNIGNTCASVYILGDKIVVGEGPELKKGKVYKGNICTDLWNGTIIDESQFIEMLTKNGMSLKQAKTELKQIKDFWTTISITVKPGTYKLSFCGNYEDFNKKYRKKNKDLPKEYKPYFTLERIKK